MVNIFKFLISNENKIILNTLAFPIIPKTWHQNLFVRRPHPLFSYTLVQIERSFFSVHLKLSAISGIICPFPLFSETENKILMRASYVHISKHSTELFLKIIIIIYPKLLKNLNSFEVGVFFFINICINMSVEMIWEQN